MRTPTLVAATAVTLALAGCGETGAPSTEAAAAPAAPTTPTAQPKTAAAAKKAAADYLDLYAAGEYGASWDEWVSSAQVLITKAQYEQLHELCPPTGGPAAFEVGKVRVVGSTAVVSVTRLGMPATVRFKHEAGRWRWVPLGAGLRDYKRLHAGQTTVAKLAAEKRAQGACQT